MLGFVLGVLTVVMFLSEPIREGWDSLSKIRECQQELPRNQSCKIIAIPEGEINE